MDTRILLALVMAILEAGDRAHPTADIGGTDYYAQRAADVIRKARETATDLR